MKRQIVGIIGGGQLGRMLIQAGIKYPVIFHVYSDTEDFPSKSLCHSYKIGSLDDYDRIVEFGKQCDIITIEIENVNVAALKQLRDVHHKKLYPDPDNIELIQDRLTQKQFLSKYVPTLPFNNLTSVYYPSVNKVRRGGYDGYGTKILKNENDKMFTEPSIIEPYYNFEKELAVQIARNKNGTIVIYPIVETVFTENNMLDFLLCPFDSNLNKKINEIAITIVEKLNYVGILAIELFKKGDDIQVNELAPRPHNSGHYTQDMFDISQFDMLMRCLLDLPLSTPVKNSYYGATVNMLGIGNGFTVYNNIDQLLTLPGVYVHTYDKQVVKQNRKMGHVNILANSINELMDKINDVKHLLKTGVTGEFVSDSVKPVVGVIMGSRSDLEVMNGAVEILKSFKIPYEVKTVSAHRTPELMLEYGKNAENRGLKVIIAGAGGAAHLPGMIASFTNLPVIGVPIKSRNSIDGWDSLLSIVQMPEGVPVATVGLNNSKNAGLLAARILGFNYETEQYRLELKKKVY